MKPVVNLEQKLALIEEQWSPRIIAALNGQLVKLTKIQGEFSWHQHAAEDELFVVPRGVQHRPVSVDGASILLFEPESTRNTGEQINERTQSNLEWI